MQNYKPIVKPLPGCVAASMRRVIPDHGALFDLMPNVMGPEMMRLGCECAVPAYCFNICRDGEYRETDIDMEMCEAVVEAKEDSDIVTFKTIPGCRKRCASGTTADTIPCPGSCVRCGVGCAKWIRAVRGTAAKAISTAFGTGRLWPNG